MHDTGAAGKPGIPEPAGGGRKTVLSGDYAYVTIDIDGSAEILAVVDVSEPTTPILAGTWELEIPGGAINDMALNGSYMYLVAGMTTFLVMDITNPVEPVELSSVESCYKTSKHQNLFVSGNYVFVASNIWTQVPSELYCRYGLFVLDISNASNPRYVSYLKYGDSSSFELMARGINVADGKAYMTTIEGIWVTDISNPAAPETAGRYESIYGKQIVAAGNTLYVAGERAGLVILDASNPASLNLIGQYNTEGKVKRLEIAGDYLYAAVYREGLQVLDISNPSAPELIGQYDYNSIRDVSVKGNYAYLAGYTFKVLDISNPAAPTQVELAETWNVSYIFVDDQYAYLSGNRENGQWQQGEMTIVDISDPLNPTLAGQLDTRGNGELYVDNNYAYYPYRGGIYIYDVSAPESISYINHFSSGSSYSLAAENICLDGNYIYAPNYNRYDTGSILKAFDISTPAAPTLAGATEDSGLGTAACVKGNNIYVAAGGTGEIQPFSIANANAVSRIALEKHTFHFSATSDGRYNTPAQSLYVANGRRGTLNWQAASDRSWLQVTPTGSAGSQAEVSVSLDGTGLAPGTYSGTATFTAANTVNSPQRVRVLLTVKESGETAAPFGVFSTPGNESNVNSSIPVTGWALDDFGVETVKIYREAGQGLAYIGDAQLVKGARPDVETAYPDYPIASKAGWGYMLLTNFLPGGDGTFVLHAVAVDVEGNSSDLGTKTIYVDNGSAVKPFGALDTPQQGETISGSAYDNFGWALTPQPNTIPFDGSTLNVWIDGVEAGQPQYNRYREDIAQLLPGYNNSNGAMGQFTLDTTLYENGVHTIAWSVADDAGNVDGIGSRYFSIRNSSSDSAGSYGMASTKKKGNRFGPKPFVKTALQPKSCKKGVDVQAGQQTAKPAASQKGITVKTGSRHGDKGQKIVPGKDGKWLIKIGELERLEIDFHKKAGIGNPLKGFLMVGKKYRPLPIGSTLDVEQGIFYWQPGPGFVGKYRFLFMDGHFKREVCIEVGSGGAFQKIQRR
ncbi:MAG: hypothetical protein GY757_27965 [bacterium]|nr:hypothetical protein [bacterium]